MIALSHQFLIEVVFKLVILLGERNNKKEIQGFYDIAMLRSEVTFKQDFRLQFIVTGNKKFVNTHTRAENIISSASWQSFKLTSWKNNNIILSPVQILIVAKLIFTR